MNRNYSGLTSIGSEIISSSLRSQRNLLFSAKKRPKLVVKSYKVTDDSSILDNKTNKNKNTKENKQENKNSNSNINTKNNLNNNNYTNNVSTTKLKETKKESSLDLSNIKYKDGYILKDAVNSNPGFGLWSVKTPIEDASKKNFADTKININEEFKTINVIDSNKNNNNFDVSDISYKYTKFFDEDKIGRAHV